MGKLGFSGGGGGGSGRVGGVVSKTALPGVTGRSFQVEESLGQIGLGI